MLFLFSASPSMSFLKHRPNREHIRALLPDLRSSKASASTDDIPSLTDTDAGQDSARTLSRTASEPPPLFVRRTSSSQSLASIFTVSATSSPDSMSGKITITFSAPGVHPPVYVVTSLSSPPWTVLEMHPAGEGIFSRTFEGAPVGSHQYKVRIGEGHWVVDERQEISEFFLSLARPGALQEAW